MAEGATPTAASLFSFEEGEGQTMVTQRSDQDEETAGKLEPRMGLFDGICIIVGMIIGSGIFSSPGVALSNAGTAQATMFVWLAAGVLCLWGSLCYAELGVAYPHAGGEYHYFDLAFGPVLISP